MCQVPSRGTWRFWTVAWPVETPAAWSGLIGEYGWDHNTLYILEDGGRLYALISAYASLVWWYTTPTANVRVMAVVFLACRSLRAGHWHGRLPWDRFQSVFVSRSSISWAGCRDPQRNDQSRAKSAPDQRRAHR